MPSGLGAPGEYPEAPLAAARPEIPWLALIAALQYLPARQRAVLILRAAPGQDQLHEPADPQDRALLDKYATAFQTADVTAVLQLLREDAVFEMPPEPTWFTGRELIGRFLQSWGLSEPGRFQLIPTAANGQPALPSTCAAPTACTAPTRYSCSPSPHRPSPGSSRSMTRPSWRPSACRPPSRPRPPYRPADPGRRRSYAAVSCRRRAWTLPGSGRLAG